MKRKSHCNWYRHKQFKTYYTCRFTHATNGINVYRCVPTKIQKRELQDGIFLCFWIVWWTLQSLYAFNGVAANFCSAVHKLNNITAKINIENGRKLSPGAHFCVLPPRHWFHFPIFHSRSFCPKSIEFGLWTLGCSPHKCGNGFCVIFSTKGKTESEDLGQNLCIE